jgi:hypothetical protein
MVQLQQLPAVNKYCIISILIMICNSAFAKSDIVKIILIKFHSKCDISFSMNLNCDDTLQNFFEVDTINVTSDSVLINSLQKKSVLIFENHNTLDVRYQLIYCFRNGKYKKFCYDNTGGFLKNNNLYECYSLDDYFYNKEKQLVTELKVKRRKK